MIPKTSPATGTQKRRMAEATMPKLGGLSSAYSLEGRISQGAGAWRVESGVGWVLLGLVHASPGDEDTMGRRSRTGSAAAGLRSR